MRVILFGEGRAGSLAHEALRQDHEIAAWFVPRRRGVKRRIAQLVQRQTPLRREEMQTLDVSRLGADILCISGFPWILPERLLGLPAINAHPSLLPRHRGPLPLFWIYHSDDRETGVTIHRVEASVDAGPVLMQHRFELTRGFPVAELALIKQRRGAKMLRDAIARIAAGVADERAQDSALATAAPKLIQGARMIDFETWRAERVWHVLRGLHPFFKEPVGVEYSGVGKYEQTSSSETPGSLSPSTNGWKLHCLDGFVELTS